MFDGAVVAIEAATPPAPVHIAAAVKGCSAALGAGRCTDPEPALELAPEWRAVLIASPAEEPLSIVVEVRRDGVLFRRRELHFTPLDAVEMRWSTAGAVVAAIISGELERRARAAPPETPSRPTPSGAASEPSRDDATPFDAVDPVPSPPWFGSAGSGVELLVTGGTEVYRGPLEFGALLRAKWALYGGPFLLTGIGGAAVPHNPLLVQSDAFVGLGAPFPVSQALAIDVSTSVVGEWLWVRHETGSGQRDAGSRWRFGGGLDIDVRARVVGCWAAVFGGHATFLWPEVDVRRPPRQVAIVLPAGLGIALGVRYDLGDGCRR